MNAQFDVNGVILETERLILRPWQISDLDDFYEYASVPGVGERAGWPHHENKDKSLEILNKFINEKKTVAICFKETGKVIGSLGIEKYNPEDRLKEFSNLKGREIGYVLSKDYWRQGLMTEAVKKVISYLFNDLDYDFLLCGAYDFNKESKRVQEKCGFIPYRKLIFDTILGTKEPGILSLLLNPNKQIELDYSLPKTLIIKGYEYIDLRLNPEWKGRSAKWFSSKWHVDEEAYLAEMDKYISHINDYGWYICVKDNHIIGGVGVITNDFHERKDLYPNVCALYVEEEYRGKRIAKDLLQIVIDDAKKYNINKLYLLTDHDCFYEQYGWQFYCMTKNDYEDYSSRLYVYNVE